MPTTANERASNAVSQMTKTFWIKRLDATLRELFDISFFSYPEDTQDELIEMRGTGKTVREAAREIMEPETDLEPAA